ncbi:alpha/beta fold hydrolase [Pseudorhodoferax sp.]|uniref:alpha/beta fold hydrolase n=1 Tax=Pseudorhodoferax sp. TaxID=1993553 RepID=UPI002DD6B3E0|nr:alpha/beta fold hydrolase [Pseudorhodoferax sp.]
MPTPPRPRSLVLLPGLACDAALWAGLLPALASRHHVSVSDVHTRCDTLPAMAHALVDGLPPGAHVLAGCSMGGMVAMHAALQAPHRVAALALLGTSARADTPELVALRRQACVLFEQGRIDDVLRANVAFAFHPRNAADPAQVQAYLALVTRAGAAQLVRQNQAVLARPDLRPRLPTITCPTLVLVGEADALTPPEHAREIAAAIPGAQLDTVAGAGHMLTLEQPAAVSERLLAWMATLP